MVRGDGSTGPTFWTKNITEIIIFPKHEEQTIHQGELSLNQQSMMNPINVRMMEIMFSPSGITTTTKNKFGFGHASIPLLVPLLRQC